MPTWMIYGANGYSGELIARKAVEMGMRPVLAGRSKKKIVGLADELGCEHRIFPLYDQSAIPTGLQGINAVLLAAGPFSQTAQQMVTSCLRNKVHYLDITGEIDVFEMIFSRKREAERAGVTLLPGVGFDVVPTDCLAARLKTEQPCMTHLELGIFTRGSFSRGTLKTMLEGMPQGSAVRRDGEIVRVPANSLWREIDFKVAKTKAVAIPWGDVSTAYYSTGVGNITVFMGMDPGLQRITKITQPLVKLLGTKAGQKVAQRLANRLVTGPSSTQRQQGFCMVWGQATDADGQVVQGHVRVLEGYTFTAVAAVECMRRVLLGEARIGALTPSMAFGSELVSSLQGTERLVIQRPKV